MAQKWPWVTGAAIVTRRHLVHHPDEVEMKGRRKVRTDKWRIKELVIKEARAILTTRAVTNGRFLNIAAQSMLEEPVGLLAGSCGAQAGSPSNSYRRIGNESEEC